MSVNILQSQNIHILFEHLQAQIQQYRQYQSVFAPIHVVVPNHGISQWLTQRIAQKQGIHANINYTALRTLQWQLYQQVLGQKRVAAAPHMLNMKWRIFLFLQHFWRQFQQGKIDEQHALYSILQHVEQHYPSKITADRTHDIEPNEQDKKQKDLIRKQENMLYWVADHCSRLFANYMIYRGECVKNCPNGQCNCRQNWLKSWGKNQPLSVNYQQLRAKIDNPLVNQAQSNQQSAQVTAQQAPPEQQLQLDYASQLEQWQRFIWFHAFADDFEQMQSIDRDFWQSLANDAQQVQKLPARIFLFTLLELPPAQLAFLQRLGQYVDIILFHYSPSKEYFADSVDPRWKAKFSMENPQAAAYYDSHHALLTRLGKQARDHSALLVELSGGEFGGEWIDDFSEFEPQNLLQKLQSDILHLSDSKAAIYTLQADDKSIQFHICHSTLRQLEVLKQQLLHWLDDADAKARGEQRQPQDILVLLPDIQGSAEQIRTVFSRQHEQNAGYVPIKISGIAPTDAMQLWQAIRHRMQLLQQRFSISEFMEWLSLMPIQQVYGLDYDALQRIQKLLEKAGFRRGFDTEHLKNTLVKQDTDYRFSFYAALQRLSLSIAVPERSLFHGVLGMAEVQHSDFELIAILLKIYDDLNLRRDWLALKNQHDGVQQQLDLIEQELQAFQQHSGYKVVDNALKTLSRTIRMSLLQSNTLFSQALNFEKLSGDHQPQKAQIDLFSNQAQQASSSTEIRLPLQYLLDEISSSVEHQVAQTEPTGQITFAQIGQLRPLPYRLIVALNLDAGVFPNRDHRIAFDLMAELRGELGDRSRLEDDQGSFLDALLQAQDAFWVFYNGFDSQGSNTKQPSSIVQELMSHISLISQGDINQQDKVHIAGIDVVQGLQQLYHVHSLQPFAVDNFIAKQPLAYHSQWFDVAQQLQKAKTENKKGDQAKSEHWRDAVSHPIDFAQSLQLTAEQWIKDLSHPEQLYLSSIAVQNIKTKQELNDFESLNLNNLERYQLQEQLHQYIDPKHSSGQLSPQQSHVLQQQLQDILPIGAVQQPAWTLAQTQYAELFQQAQQYGSISPCKHRTWQLSVKEDADIPVKTIEFSMAVPDFPPDATQKKWVDFSIKSEKPERRLADWLHYLLWRASESADGEYRYIKLYKNATVTIENISQQDALKYLKAWIKVWFLAQQQLLILPPHLLMDILAENTKANNKAVQWMHDEQGELYIQNLDVLIKKWLDSPYNAKDYQTEYYDLNDDWQLLIDKDKASQQFNIAVQKYAEDLYYPISEHMQVEK
ncbi:MULTISPECIES: exodeoxyribonuclease V subunit gamma [unclassified Acinetobacter]|uniref:exodeoxyribonuclease V subunit gamma n=1 Tax=unclassified Acinetobacter TaxID=196816 RepID=UPI0035B77BD8